MSILIQGGLLVCDGESQPMVGDLLIKGELISAIGPHIEPPEDCKIIDACGKIVMPGAIDPHVHFHYPQGANQIWSADDWRSGPVAAAMGGTTTVIDFIEAKPGETLMHALQDRNADANGKSILDYSFHMSITRTDDETISEVPKVVNEGITSFKIYTAYNGIRLTYEQLPIALSAVSKSKGISIIHSEDHEIIVKRLAECAEKGRTECKWHPYCHPIEGEFASNKKIVEIVKKLKQEDPNYGRIHIVHVSTADGGHLIRQTRESGIDITGEVCPQHLVLDESLYSDRPDDEEKASSSSSSSSSTSSATAASSTSVALTTQQQEIPSAAPSAFRCVSLVPLTKQPPPAAFVMAPPLRPQSERMNLMQAVEKGDALPFITSDHCPFSSMQKYGQRRHPEKMLAADGSVVDGVPSTAWWDKEGSPPFSAMPGGGAGVEVRVMVAYSYCVVERSWSLPQFVSFVSTAAAKRFDLYPKKGVLKVGSDADVVVWDPNATCTLTQSNMHMMTDLFPYEGFQIRGRPEKVIVRGRMIKDSVDGGCLSYEPRGKLLRRTPAM
ncbi:dihydropyrimidinase [Monocercomonoides exilis]|uniref:dihydropyrimidinase n=1 Tax=Monocercomonoides exilis TaxID=2049356 RepID=UPI0035594729|nr:dihydropyrimidinase [Monocercomonoides exilis]|eukprot:MONOS_10029.1-p1 / transcript=MONOS_10029.1 / gene=MONOS_10029 / organism=Monocercomonoides_exilis_PA203 / gene_product=dihydropyrimidinase [EC:3.5.2.2] / transcript_product=dihydropyrimidinase [EC:3.5.2.2] / location=Mono_scaffold00438:17499-20045(-) / protein_length=554 / sequence_SO=supercontig / SO=protein_coding / is_pseudo=false